MNHISVNKFKLTNSQPTGYLTKETMGRLQAFFTERNHRPSVEMWGGLQDLASTMEKMVNGECEKKYYLSSLDPGVGKTQTISKFVQVLVSVPSSREVGVVIFVNRLSQIENLVKDLALPQEQMAILTSDVKGVNLLGTLEANRAQVLITTQQRAELELNGGNFKEAKVFHYLGRTRAVRLWDEAFLPGHPIAFNADDIGFLFRPIRLLSQDLHTKICEIFQEINQVADGNRYTIPDFVLEYGIELNDILGFFDDSIDGNDRSIKDEQRQIATLLWYLSGRTVNIRKDGKYGNTIIDYCDTLPEDFAPLLVLDASGRCRTTYDDIENERKSLVRLRQAVKRYDNLTIHVWQTGGGKSAWSEKGNMLTEGIVKTVSQKPDEKWLVVIHKKDRKTGEIEKQIREQLPEQTNQNVAFLTWGNHMATNEYANVPNIILAGTLFYRPSYYEALKRLAAGMTAEDGDVSKGDIERITVGEHRHLILQALCRGTVRRCDGEVCHPMNAYIIASVRSGIKEELPNLFPSCSVEQWSPNPRTLKGKVKEAIDFLAEWYDQNQDSTIKFSTVYEAIKVKSPEFSNDIRKHPDFREALSELGLYEDGKNTRMTIFARNELLQ